MIHLEAGFYVRSLALMAACVSLVGCATQLQRVNVPVPVECRESVPERPAMPTESLVPGVEPFVLTRAALAEIDRREGYEIKLRAALLACTAPLEARS